MTVQKPFARASKTAFINIFIFIHFHILYILFTINQQPSISRFSTAKRKSESMHVPKWNWIWPVWQDLFCFAGLPSTRYFVFVCCLLIMPKYPGSGVWYVCVSGAPVPSLAARSGYELHLWPLFLFSTIVQHSQWVTGWPWYFLRPLSVNMHSTLRTVGFSFLQCSNIIHRSWIKFQI